MAVHSQTYKEVEANDLKYLHGHQASMLFFLLFNIRIHLDDSVPEMIVEIITSCVGFIF
jgi:hypothetical protein